MKKRMALFLTAVMLVSLLSVSVCAKIGDIAGAVYYTDIRASINGYPIESYNVDGYTAVCAEDLEHYGFFVRWYGDARLLNIEVYTEYEVTPPEYIYPEITEPIGSYRMPYLETDIQVVAGGTVIPSWNIDGRTLVRLKDLTMFGTAVWDPTARTSAFTTFQQWKMNYDILTPPTIGVEMPEITGFDLTFAKDAFEQFHMDGENAPYFSTYNIVWNFSARGASVQISFYQNDKGISKLISPFWDCVNWDYRENLAVTPKAEIAQFLTLQINGEEKNIHTIGISQGNGHIDFILSADGYYPREAVQEVRLLCEIPEKK